MLNNTLAFVDPFGLEIECYGGQTYDYIVSYVDGEYAGSDLVYIGDKCGGGGAAGGGGGGGGSHGPKRESVLVCASKTANVFSIPGVLAPNGSAETNPLLFGLTGNTFSGIVDLGSHVHSVVNASSIKNAAVAAGQVATDVVTGGAGVPLGKSWWAKTWLVKGLAGLATDAADAAVAAPVAAEVGGEALLGPIGLGKFAFDGAVFGGSLYTCFVQHK